MDWGTVGLHYENRMHYHDEATETLQNRTDLAEAKSEFDHYLCETEQLINQLEKVTVVPEDKLERHKRVCTLVQRFVSNGRFSNGSITFYGNY